MRGRLARTDAHEDHEDHTKTTKDGLGPLLLRNLGPAWLNAIDAPLTTVRESATLRRPGHEGARSENLPFVIFLVLRDLRVCLGCVSGAIYCPDALLCFCWNLATPSAASR